LADQVYGLRNKSPFYFEPFWLRALVAAALRAVDDFSAGLRLRETARACLDSASCDAALPLSFFKAFIVARDRVCDTGLFCPFFSSSFFACLRVDEGTEPFLGTFYFTPARRASDKPMAMACFADLAPCSPSRILSISARTNSPACVPGESPRRLSAFAF
jgi:hypothetical protein